MSKKHKKRDTRNEIRDTEARRRRRFISIVEAKSLGYTCENLTAADAISCLDVTLAGLFRYKKYSNLKAAFERGQFLRNLKGLASVVETVSEAARALKLAGGGMELRALLDSDPEAADLWDQARLDAKIKTREGLFKAVEAGNQQAIRVVENYLKDDIEQGPGADLTKLMQKEIADIFDTTRVTVSDWTNKQKCPRNADGSYNLYEVVRWHTEFIKSKITVPMAKADDLRSWKVKKLQLEVEEERKALVRIENAYASFVARYERIVASCRHKAREIATMAHGQTVDAIEKLIKHHHEDMQRQWAELPEFLSLPKEAEATFDLLIRQIKGE